MSVSDNAKKSVDAFFHDESFRKMVCSIIRMGAEMEKARLANPDLRYKKIVKIPYIRYEDHKKTVYYDSKITRHVYQPPKHIPMIRIEISEFCEVDR